MTPWLTGAGRLALGLTRGAAATAQRAAATAPGRILLYGAAGGGALALGGAGAGLGIAAAGAGVDHAIDQVKPEEPAPGGMSWLAFVLLVVLAGFALYLYRRKAA